MDSTANQIYNRSSSKYNYLYRLRVKRINRSINDASLSERR
jgi:hypothetical protein